jgi:DNA-binding NtrC family response regulator
MPSVKIDGFIAKPVSLKDLINIVENILRKEKNVRKNTFASSKKNI